MKSNPNNFRVFSPDELASNKLDAVLEITKRQFEPQVAEVYLTSFHLLFFFLHEIGSKFPGTTTRKSPGDPQ